MISFGHTSRNDWVHDAAAELAGYAYGASECTFFFFSLPKEIMYIYGMWLIGFFFFFHFFSVLLSFKNGFTETLVHVVWQHTVSVSRLRNNTKLLHVRRHDGYDSILIFWWAACLCYGNWHFFCVDDVKWTNLVLFESMNTQRATWYSVFTQSSRPSVMNYLCVAINDFWPLSHSVNPWRMDIRVSWLCPSQLLVALIVAAQSVQRLLWWRCVTEPYSLYNYYLPF